MTLEPSRGNQAMPSNSLFSKACASSAATSCASMPSHALTNEESVSSVCALERSTPRMASPYSSTRNSISSSADAVVTSLNIYCNKTPSAIKTTATTTVSAVRRLMRFQSLFSSTKNRFPRARTPPPKICARPFMEANGAVSPVDFASTGGKRRREEVHFHYTSQC